MQSPPFHRYLVPPRSKYSPQHLVLKHPQLPFLPQWKTGKNTITVQPDMPQITIWLMRNAFWITTATQHYTTQHNTTQTQTQTHTHRCVILISLPSQQRLRQSVSKLCLCQCADKSLARPGRKQASEACQATRAISTTSRRELSSSSFFLQGKAPKEIHAILTETLGCFLPDRAKNLSAPLYIHCLCCYVEHATRRLSLSFQNVIS